MPLVKECAPSCLGIDCALDTWVDPSPNDPGKVRDAMGGSGLYVHVRMTGETENMLETVKKLLHPDLKLIIQPAYIDKATAEKNYAVLEKMLSDFYSV